MTEQTIWSGVLPVYLFLGGLGGALLVLVAIFDIAEMRRFRRSSRTAAWSALACIIIGTALLLIDVRMPERAIILWESFTNPNSWLARGAWLLAASIPIAFAYALAVRGAWPGTVCRRIFAVVAAAVGIGIVSYTGFLLNAASAVPAWHTALIPALFCASAMSSAIAFMNVLVLLCERKKCKSKSYTLHVIALFSSIAEATLLLGYILWLLYFSPETKPSADLLLIGRYSIQFWVGIILCGILYPFAHSIYALVTHSSTKVSTFIESALVLTACLILRFLVLSIGMYPAVGVLPL